MGGLAAEQSDSVVVKARQELFAARYENAAGLFSKALAEGPSDGDAWCGLVQALLAAKHSRQAYAAAEEALNKAPQSAGAQAAMGFADFRRGICPKPVMNLRLRCNGTRITPRLSSDSLKSPRLLRCSGRPGIFACAPGVCRPMILRSRPRTPAH